MKTKPYLLTAAALLLFGCVGHPQQGALDKAAERRIDSLLDAMTPEEKIGQLNQVTTAWTAEAMADDIRSGKIGSILNEVNPETVNAMQRIAVEESQTGIPLLFARDVIHGFRTILPIPLGQAATFDPELVEQGARNAAVEATACGVRWTFSPMVDVSRDARWGRIAESSGEDTYLNAVMGVATVNGYQGAPDGDPTLMAACVKHYVGYGAAESGRDYNSTNIPERQLRNVYLPPFEACVDAGAMTLMTSFNDNDGIPATGNRWLLRDVLRDEWDFGGMVVTDWNSAGEMVAHGYASDSADAAAKAINAGVDMDMMSFSYIRNLSDLLRDGRVDERRLDEAVRNVLRLKYRLGLFDNPYVDPVRAANASYTEEHLAAARKCAEESAILLQNEGGVLPFDAAKQPRLLLTGPMADAPYEQLGTWSFDGEAAHTVTPLKALRDEYGDRIGYLPVLKYSRSEAPAAALNALTAAARNYDAVVVFVGEEAILSGEAHCLANLDLQGSQSDLIAAARRSGKPVVTVVMAGRPLSIGRDLKNTDALIYLFHPGTMGGPALADLLFGKASPSGKLPASIPSMTGQTPVYYSCNATGRPASGSETLLHQIAPEAGQTSLGCSSYMLDAGFGPLFPFGYGLSYTTFEYGEPTLDRDDYSADDTIRVAARLTNTGKRTGTEVVQLYVRDMVGAATRPVKELKAFRRITLTPGESCEVEFQLPVSELAYWGPDLKKRVEAGDFRVWIAGSSAEGTPAAFSVR